MKIGIVTTWFERGAAHVSRQFMDILQKTDEVYIYARGGEKYAKGNPVWDLPNVWWGKRSEAHMKAYGSTYIFKGDFIKWINKTNVDAILFNEQQWFEPVVWVKEIGIKAIAYIDYYTENLLPLYDIYDCVICNTKKHAFAFRQHKNAVYMKWGTNIDLYKPNEKSKHDKTTFFHSAGMAPIRKGTDIVLRAFYNADNRKNAKLILHTQVSIARELPQLLDVVHEMEYEGSLEVVEGSIPAPGLYYRGDIYLYPSRLDGIGLTLMEAIASGLAVITSDNAPMNEFVESSFGDVCPIDYYYCRQDGYYWPMCVCNIQKLTELIDSYIDGKKNLNKMKKAARVYAEKELDSSNNFKMLHRVIENSQFLKNYEEAKEKIQKYNSLGTRRLSKYLVPLCYLYLKFVKK